MIARVGQGVAAPRGGRRPTPSRSGGFTLIEIVVAMILVSLVMAISVGAIRMSRQSAAAGEYRIEAINAVRVTQEFLRKQFARTLPLAFAIDRREGRNIVFEGERREIRFVAPMPGYLSSGGPYIQRLTLERGELRFYHRMLLSDDDEEDGPVVLLDRIRGGGFEYRGIDDRGRLGDWRPDWEDPARTPMMVRLHLEFQDGTEMIWPDLEVPLLIDVGGVNNAYRFFGPSDDMDMGQQMGTQLLGPGGLGGRPGRPGRPQEIPGYEER